VLDWGGSGKPLVLLTGSGNTAHVFDELAGKLTLGPCLWSHTAWISVLPVIPTPAIQTNVWRMMSFMCWTRLNWLLPFWWAIPWEETS